MLTAGGFKTRGLWRFKIEGLEDRTVFFSWIGRRLPMAYLTSGVVKYVDIYEIYVDLLFEE